MRGWLGYGFSGSPRTCGWNSTNFGAGEPDGIEILKEIRSFRADLPVILLTGKGSVDAAVEAVQEGAADFIEKDLFVEDKLELSMEKVERMLDVLRENARLRAENEALDRDNIFYRTELGQRYKIVSGSERIDTILQQIEQIASIPRPVLVSSASVSFRSMVKGNATKVAGGDMTLNGRSIGSQQRCENTLLYDLVHSQHLVATVSPVRRA